MSLIAAFCGLSFLLAIKITSKLSNFILHQFGVLHKLWDTPIDVYTSAGYILRIDCWEAEKDLKTTPGSDCALNALAIDEPLEYAILYLDGTMQM